MENEKLNFDGVDYEIDALSEKARYFVIQLKDLRQKVDKCKLELDQLEVATTSFTELLSIELKAEQEFVAS